MSSNRHLVAAMVGVALLLGGGTACQTSRPDAQGSTVTTQSAEMSDLPDDEIAAKAVVRKRLIDETIVLLKASGLKYTNAQFDVPTSPDHDDTQNGDLTIGFDPCSDAQMQAMTSAISTHGWKQGSISHSVNVRKGPLRLQLGNGFGGCLFEMTTVNISQHLLVTDDITRVPELAAFKARP